MASISSSPRSISSMATTSKSVTHHNPLPLVLSSFCRMNYEKFQKRDFKIPGDQLEDPDLHSFSYILFTIRNEKENKVLFFVSEFNQNVLFADFRQKKRCARTGHGTQFGEEKQTRPAVPGDRCQRVCLQNSVSTSTLLENIESSASEIHYAKREKVKLYTFHLFKDASFLFLFSLSFSSYAYFCTSSGGKKDLFISLWQYSFEGC